MTMTDLKHGEQLDDLLRRSESGFILKHSTRCPVSAEAHREFSEFVDKHPEIPAYIVLVVENRETSNAVADRLGIAHASPQAILVREGRPAWSATHWDVTSRSLEVAWSD